MLYRIVSVLLLAAMLSLLFGCVSDNSSTEQTAESPTENRGEASNEESPSDQEPSNEQEPTLPDDTIVLPEDDFLIPDEEQVDRNGFPNPPEEEATKRY